MSTKAKRERLKEQREVEKCNLIDFCEKHKLETVHVTEYQIRVMDTIDVYPTNKKFSLIKKHPNVWGWYSKPEELLKYLSTSQNGERSVK